MFGFFYIEHSFRAEVFLSFSPPLIIWKKQTKKTTTTTKTPKTSWHVKESLIQLTKFFLIILKCNGVP